MATFKDVTGREWKLDITYGDVVRVLKDTGTDLGKLIKPDNKRRAFDPLAELLQDPARLVPVVFSLIEPQAKASGVEPEAFANSLNGDSLEDMADAFYEAFVNFSPRRLREPLSKMAAKGKEVVALAATKALAEIENLEPEKMVQQIAAGMKTGSMPSSGVSAENSAA